MRPLPDADYLRQCLSYNPDTGDLRWKERPPSHFKQPSAAKVWNRRYAGSPIKRYKGQRYPTLAVNGVTNFLAHRIIWKMMTGTDPTEEVDHEHGDRDNLRWEYLRAAARSQNTKNRRANHGCAVDLKGVIVKGRRYGAQISADKKHYWLGTFDTPEQAHAAYCEAAKRLHGEFFNPG